MNRRSFLSGGCLGALVATVTGMFRRKVSAATPVARRPGMELVFDPAACGDPSGIVTMTIFQDSLFVCTERRVYLIRRDAQDEWEVSPVSPGVRGDAGGKGKECVP